jgi:peptidyl-prolyl cis-trans isomerase SurA
MNFKTRDLLIVFALLAASATASAATSSAIQTIDQIAAVVNDEVITRQELERRYLEITEQMRSQKIQLPPRKLLEQQLLDRMITELALLQFAKNSGIRVDPVQVERAIQRIAQQNKLTVEQLRVALERDGVNYERFRDNIRNEILLTRTRERQVENKLTVSDAEIEGYLQSQSALGKDEEFNLSHILVTVPENASPEQIQSRKARAEDILDQLNKGGDFAQLSASYSDAPNALQGGGLGWKTSGQIPALFLDSLRSLKAGETGPLLKSANGFHIIKLNEKRGKDVSTVITQTRVRHILIKPSELTSESDAKNRLLQIRERIEQGGAKFEDLARQYSEDIGSSTKGGELSWVSPGDLVPEFQKAMDELKPGELSQPAQTPFGWHLIQVLERRQQDVTEERQRMLARQNIRERKADEAFQEWVRQVRDQSYVELRPLD